MPANNKNQYPYTLPKGRGHGPLLQLKPSYPGHCASALVPKLELGNQPTQPIPAPAKQEP